jgi:putative DNA primase/helicase
MSFIHFAHSHGVLIRDLVLTPRGPARCGTDLHPTSKNGAYRWDGSRGWVCAWDGDMQTHFYGDTDDKTWSEEEKAAWRAQKQAVKQAQEREYAQASRRAQEDLRRAKPAAHDYLHRKGFPEAQGLVLPSMQVWMPETRTHRIVQDVLLIPMRSPAGAVQGVQQIWWEPAERKFIKKMTYGMRAKGAVFRMGDKHATETWLCEGYATGLSIQAALRSIGMRAAVLVCFSSGNLVHAAPEVSGRRFVFADNDPSGAGEKAARSAALPFCMSPAVGEDANDLHARAGLMAVCAEIMKARREAVMS